MEQIDFDDWERSARERFLLHLREGLAIGKAARRTLPSPPMVAAYWRDRLFRMGRDCHDHSGPACFACGCTASDAIQRAHIQAVTTLAMAGHRYREPENIAAASFPNELENIHLLCTTCHYESEMLGGENYWAWFRQMSPMARLAINAFKLAPELAEAALLRLIHGDPDRFCHLLGHRLLEHADERKRDAPALQELRLQLKEIL